MLGYGLMRRYTLTEILAGLAIALAITFPLTIYFLNFHGRLSANHSRWAEFGSYLAGVYVVPTLAVLVYTTFITRKQFQIQNEDNLFFKLYDSLQNRISNSTIVVDDKTYTGYHILKILVKRFYEELYEQSIEIARLLLSNNPENISDIHFDKIFEAIEESRPEFSLDRQKFIDDINGYPDKNERLKYYIGSRGEESRKLRKALFATGSVNFYKIRFDERRARYIQVVESISASHGEFLDGYFKDICFLLMFVAKTFNRAAYINFLKSQLTKYELIIIFYLVAGRDTKLGSMKNLMDFGFMDELLTIGCQSLMIDCPSDKVMKKEIDYVFTDSTKR